MKKLLLILAFSFLFILGAKTANATSGTCSWHGGVNCSAGPDWDGSAICNDGWTDSSESYYSQSMCQEMLCTEAEFQNLVQKYIYSIKNPILEINNKTSALQSERDEEIRDINDNPWLTEGVRLRQIDKVNQKYEDELNNMYDSVWRMQDMYNTELDNANWLVEMECKALGAERGYKYREEAIKAYLDYQDVEAQKTEVKDTSYSPSPLAKETNNIEDIKCSSNQTLYNGYCVNVPLNAHSSDNGIDAWLCDDGYEEVGNSCVKENIEEVPNIEEPDVVIGEELAPPLAPEIKEKAVKEVKKEEPKKENIVVKFFKNIFESIGSWFR